MNNLSEQRNKCNQYECNQLGCNSIGSFNNLKYDDCAYKIDLKQSVQPLGYVMYEGKFQSCGQRCYENYYRPFDLVDIESELKNITRPATRCPQYKYNPNCKRSRSCVGTEDPSVPVVYPPNICPVVTNNIPVVRNPGYTVPRGNICGNNMAR